MQYRPQGIQNTARKQKAEQKDGREVQARQGTATEQARLRRRGQRYLEAKRSQIFFRCMVNRTLFLALHKIRGHSSGTSPKPAVPPRTPPARAEGQESGLTPFLGAILSTLLLTGNHRECQLRFPLSLSLILGKAGVSDKGSPIHAPLLRLTFLIEYSNRNNFNLIFTCYDEVVVNC